MRPGARVPRRALRLLAGAALLALAGCSFPVQGAFIGRELPAGPEARRTIVILYNHGFSAGTAGTYRPTLPPILQAARDRNPDVVVFSQVRNASRLEAVHHSSYVAAAVDHFERLGVPRENIILAGQSCGGWGSLQAAAYSYPEIGGVVAFAPTCHGRLPHSTETRIRRRSEIAAIAARANFPGVLFVYEGDSYYELEDWAKWEQQAREAPVQPRVERVGREAMARACPRCTTDTHGAVWDPAFSAIYLESHLQPLIDEVRARIRAREGK